MDNGTLKVLIIGPGRKTEGGITEVIDRIFGHMRRADGISASWIATHRSGSVYQKIVAAACGVLRALRQMPTADVVHIHSSASISFFRKSIIFWIAKVWRKPIIWHLHSPNKDFTAFFGASGFSGWYARSVLRHCSRIVVLTDSWRALVEPYISLEKVQVIPNPIPEIEDIDWTAVDREAGRILYLAHLIPRKGYSTLIEAFARVAKQFPQSRLVFAGSGELENAQSICHEMNIEDRVEFLGWIGEPARTNELLKASIFVLPSYQEGLPMGILEAMAFGLAVVVTPVGGIPDVVVQDHNGILVSPGSNTELSSALGDLLASTEKRDRIGAQANLDVRKYAPAKIAQEWMYLYRDVVPGQWEPVIDDHQS